MASLSALQAAQLTLASRTTAGPGGGNGGANSNGTTTNGGSGSSGNNNRASLSSFPPSRSPSSMSTASRPPRSPQPPTTADLSSYSSAYNSGNGNGHTRPSEGSSSANNTTMAAGSANLKPHVRSPRRLRSQYPRSSIENHVEYILVASFDIDRGPVMEHQYPVAITGDEHMLAELMLPDQAHARNQDWTIFFLHKDTSQEEDEEEQKEKEARRRRRRRRRDRANGILPAEGEGEDEDEFLDEDDDEDDDDDDDWSEDGSVAEEPEGGEGPPLIYVLNLVNTKHDKTVKRGAIVKTMAICTRHPFLHIYKPLLLLALEEYFKAPVPETLAMLYEAVNSMDLSLMPKLSLLERNLLQASDNKDLFVEKFEQIIQRRMARTPAVIERGSPEVPKNGDPKRPTIQRAGTKAHLEGHSEFAVPRDTHEFESKVMYKGIPIPVKVPTAIMPETVGDFSLVKLIQQFSEPHAKAPQPFNTHPHLTTNGPLTHPIIVLANALLTQKRIIFLGHNMPSGEVAEAVLAACALASGGVLRGFTRHAFPYTDLTKIDDLLKVPGFIAGVTNPTFEMHPEWWDLLCDLPSGRMKISSRLEQLPPTEGLVYFQQQNPGVVALINGPSTGDLTSDTVFMNDILRSIATRQGERVIRAKWRDWVVKFARMSAAFEESVYGASALYIGGDEAGASALGKNGHGYVWPDENSKQKELAGNVHRIEGWRNTRSYYSFIQDLAQIYTVRPLKGLDLHHLHDRLRTQRLTPAQSREIYLSFANSVITYDEICLLLSVAPESHGGLFYLALGLLHKDRDVRIATADLLERISEHEAGQHWWKGLSRFEKLAYHRIRRDAENAGRGGDAAQLSGGGSGYSMTESDKRAS